MLFAIGGMIGSMVLGAAIKDAIDDNAKEREMEIERMRIQHEYEEMEADYQHYLTMACLDALNELMDDDTSSEEFWDDDASSEEYW